MTKEVFNKEVKPYIQINGKKLSDLVSTFQAILQDHPNAFIDMSIDEYSVDISVWEDVEETDEDYAARLKQEAESTAARIKAEEDNEKRMWEALKAKYGE